MKLFSLFLMLFMTITFQSNAQSYYLSMNGEVLASDTTIIVVPDVETPFDIMFGLNFHNNTNNGVNIKVLRNEVMMVDGSANFFKWVEQYDDTINLSLESSYIPAGSYSIDGLFLANYSSMDIVGVSVVEYTFFNVDNIDENVKITVNFDTSPQGINDNIFNNSWVSDVYPNPTVGFVNIDYNFPHEVVNANVKLYNLMGAEVKYLQLDLQNSSATMNVFDINSGIYFYSVFINEELFSTKKLIVR